MQSKVDHCFRVATLFEKNDFDRKLRCRNERKIIDGRSRFIEGLDEENSPRPKCESRSPLDSTDGTSGPRQGRLGRRVKKGCCWGGEEEEEVGAQCHPKIEGEKEGGCGNEGEDGRSDAPPP